MDIVVTVVAVIVVTGVAHVVVHIVAVVAVAIVVSKRRAAIYNEMLLYRMY